MKSKTLTPQSTAAKTKVDMSHAHEPKLVFAIIGLVIAALFFTVGSLINELHNAGSEAPPWWPYILLGMALFVALGFEFVNGFHDTANAVATVIYTHSLPPMVAVIWSGFFNFLGVLVSNGTVAFAIISLLPVELILQVGSGSGFAMVFALLIAAIAWNLGTWWFGLPASSSHTMIGSIVGVGIANALMHGRDGTSGVDWEQVTKVAYALLLSPVIGFILAAGMLLLLKAVVKNRALYSEPRKDHAPPWWIRGILILTCTGVSFAHGSNDGQKGMGLIMLILVGTVPLAYALNRAMPVDQVTELAAITKVTQQSLEKMSPSLKLAKDPHAILEDYLRTHTFTPEIIPALTIMTGSIGEQIQSYNNSLAKIPLGNEVNMRKDMYLSAETINKLEENAHVSFDPETKSNIEAFKKLLNNATKFIPLWVKIIVAIALGLGTMVGWKRIVVTVGEKIGKTHLTYAQGAAAEIVAMTTIGLADGFGVPVSTTHVLSSGIAGTMAANHSGLQLDTIRNIVMAWVFTLPAAMVLSGALYWVFSHFA